MLVDRPRPVSMHPLQRYQQGTRGRFDDLATDGGAATDRAWALALRAQRARADPRVPMPDPPMIAALGTQEADLHPRLLACGDALRDALVRLDQPRAAALAAILRATPTPNDALALERSVGELWCAGFGLGPARDAGPIVRRCRDAAHPRLVIEATALAALLALHEGDATAALAGARIATRMARTEALPQPEYLANLTLARLRRVSGKPHLAVHILRALARVVPAAWHRLVRLERSLAGDSDAGLDEFDELLRAAHAGDVRGVDGAAAVLREGLGGFALRGTVEVLLALLDPWSIPPVAARRWTVEGAEGPVPLGLHGIALHHPDAALQAEPVWVHGDGRGAARRLLSTGLALLPRATRVLAPGQRGRARTDGAIAALLFAAGPIPEAGFFEALYGFPYKPANHQGARDTLYYRIRSRLADLGDLERTEEGLRLALQGPIAVPDPRFRPPPESALLTLVAGLGSASARETARRLGVPLRTAQHSLKALAAEGYCVAEREGRELRYRVEDTTFCPPTTS